MIKKYFSILSIIIFFVGCAMVKQISKGDFFDFCQDIVTDNSNINNCDISINSQGYFDITFNMSVGANVDVQEYKDIFRNVSEQLKEIYNGDRTFEDDQFEEIEIRAIGIKIIYHNDEEDEVFDYYSNYYGGETIYSNDELNVIDDFETWIGP